MNRDNTPWQPASKAKLAWQDDNTPYSTIFDDIYFHARSSPPYWRDDYILARVQPGKDNGFVSIGSPYFNGSDFQSFI